MLESSIVNSGPVSIFIGMWHILASTCPERVQDRLRIFETLIGDVHVAYGLVDELIRLNCDGNVVSDCSNMSSTVPSECTQLSFSKYRPARAR